jgi:transcriptional regulator with AAA-type ATPase domain
MSSLKPADSRLLEVLARLAYCNPFFTERIDLELLALGDEYEPDVPRAWSRTSGPEDRNRPNVGKLDRLAAELTTRIRNDSDGTKKLRLTDAQREQYWDVVTFDLFCRHLAPRPADDLVDAATTREVWRSFRRDHEFLASLPGLDAARIQPAGHLFACLWQVRRAFANIFNCILGDSRPAIQLRGAVWQSIFTTDMRRYRQSLFDRMGHLSTLITGPSGTGKELVARAIGLSQYIPFDEKREQFADATDGNLFALNLAAFAQSLVESELFGHRKGAFTGAVSDRRGWLELCRPHGAIFLDEIGELDPTLQVKLLRVVQYRTFSRLGESVERRFSGKLIGATNRDMGAEIRAGRFREDLYYRLCSDRIHTPGLREQLDDQPSDLDWLALHIARRLAGDSGEQLAAEATTWIRGQLPSDYPWPGNIRELEQCISNVMVRGEYRPQTVATQSPPLPLWLTQAAAGELTLSQLQQAYCSATWQRLGTYEAAALHLGVDRRTVKAHVDAAKET